MPMWVEWLIASGLAVATVWSLITGETLDPRWWAEYCPIRRNQDARLYWRTIGVYAVLTILAFALAAFDP